MSMPLIATQIPPPGSTDVDEEVTIHLTVVQATGNIRTFDAYVDGIDAYRAYAGFNFPSFSGTYSHFIFPDPPYAGYDAVDITISRPTPYPFGSTVNLHIVAVSSDANVLDDSSSFSIEVASPPFLVNRSPAPAQTDVDLSATLSVDILDIEAVNPSTIDAYVDGHLAHEGASGLFFPPFSGSVTPTTVGGVGGYHLEMSSSTPFSPNSLVSFRVVGRNIDELKVDESWQFRTTKQLLLSMGPYEITMDADFGRPMLLSTLLDAASYRLSGGAYVRAVDPLPSRIAPTGAMLWIEGFKGTASFDLRVSSSVLDSYGNPLPPSARAASIAPFPSPAYYSNVTGFVRSWHESRTILRDSQRAYLAGLRGLDVLDITRGPTMPFRWAQILDRNGITATCLSGSMDYMFSHTAPPILFGQRPAPGAVGVFQYAIVYFSVVDVDTAVEVSSLVIYVGGELVFSGATGWTSPSFGGQVRVRHQILDIQLYPYQPMPAGTVVVSVLATDLSGNLLSTSYSFTVGAVPPSTGGFGEGPFGFAPFGL